MDKHGIGTDATHAEHINTIKVRGIIFFGCMNFHLSYVNKYLLETRRLYWRGRWRLLGTWNIRYASNKFTDFNLKNKTQQFVERVPLYSIKIYISVYPNSF